ncbi:hypothetical protein GTY83_00825 [Streptomyces sp. SID4928]|uniref:hypothetical protein n=1 Tax=Streptomyces TaxID=1883 RepID=UPI0001C1A15E|nr:MULTISPECIES: hypothetical protein [Streptomyces]EGE39577.1 molybdopterin synthase subunit MoaE [Streptomyces sp. ACT-1]MYR47668.1 hypothetical protein [Streptomyces sp. SID4928]
MPYPAPPADPPPAATPDIRPPRRPTVGDPEPTADVLAAARRPAQLASASGRMAAFLNAVRRHRHGIGGRDVREGAVPLTGDGIGRFFTQP